MLRTCSRLRPSKIAKRYCVETVLCTDEGKPCSSFRTTDSPNISVLETYSSGRCSCMRRSWNWHLSHSVASTTWCLVTPVVFSSSLPRTRCTSPTARRDVCWAAHCAQVNTNSQVNSEMCSGSDHKVTPSERYHSADNARNSRPSFRQSTCAVRSDEHEVCWQQAHSHLACQLCPLFDANIVDHNCSGVEWRKMEMADSRSYAAIL